MKATTMVEASAMARITSGAVSARLATTIALAIQMPKIDMLTQGYFILMWNNYSCSTPRGEKKIRLKTPQDHESPVQEFSQARY